MTKRKHAEREVVETAMGADEAAAEADEAPLAAEAATPPAGESVAPPPAVAELEELRDRHLRLAAEYDNYRKRVLRERDDVRGRVQAELMRVMLDAIDDLGRVTDLDPTQTSAQDVIAGVELVERKLFKQFEHAGLARIGQVGDQFDPNEHEAVGTDETSDAAQDGTVSMIMQPGYRIGAILVRPARVRVYMVAETDHGRAGA